MRPHPSSIFGRLDVWGIRSADQVCTTIGRAKQVRDVEKVDFRYSITSEMPQACSARIAGEKVEYRRRYE